MYSQLLFPNISELSYEILIFMQVKAKIKNWTIKKQKKQKNKNNTSYNWSSYTMRFRDQQVN